MPKTALRFSAAFFLLLAGMHVLRFMLKIEVVVQGMRIAMWPSVVAAMISILLALWMFKASRK